MTASTVTSPSFEVERERIRRAVAPAALGVAVVSGFWTVLGAHGTPEIVVVLATIAVVTGGVYGFLLPRALNRPSAGGTALVLSGVAVALTLPAFWTGLPLVLGVDGAMLGYAGRGAPSGSGKAIAGCVLGLLAAMAYLAIYVIDGLVLGHI